MVNFIPAFGIALKQVGDYDKMLYVRAILSFNERFPLLDPLEPAETSD